MNDADLLSEVLSSNVAASNAAGVLKAQYKELQVFGNLTSYSMQQTLHTCPRMFQIAKLEATLPTPDDYIESDNADFAFGHAVGAGVATFDETHDLDKAMWSCFLAWDIDLFARKERRPNRPEPNKTYHHAVWAIKRYAQFCAEELDLQDYEVVKNEATIAVDFENGHFYVGHIDTLLRSRQSGRYKVKENKTTGFSTVDPALYSNSDQALSYSLVVDAIGATEYDVLYTVYSTTAEQWMAFEFTKDVLAKVEWLQDQTFIHSAIDQYEEKDFFPKRGANCIQYGRRCKYYESCDFTSRTVYGKTFRDLRKLRNLSELEEIEHIDYAFTWSELVQRQKEKLA